jgi:hypothetical protein
MTQDELNLVLDALKFCHGGEPCGTAEAIVVVEKALTQPEQEPVQVSPIEFVERTFGRGHLVGVPVIWAEWPSREKNT